MNMREPTTAWDRAPTDRELNAYYGKDKPHQVRDSIIETLTETIRTVSIDKLGLPYIKHTSVTPSTGGGYTSHLAMYPVSEVLNDYGTDKGPLKALLAVLAGSDCALVQTYREALAERYADAWADDVEEFKSE